MNPPHPIAPHPADVAAWVELTQLERDWLRDVAIILDDLAAAGDQAIYPDDPYGLARCAANLRAIAARFDDSEKHPAV